MQRAAREPNDLEKFFVERANAGDVDGLVALYEPGAVLVAEDGETARGADQIRDFLARFVAGRPRLAASVQSPAIRTADIALTSSRHGNGDVSVEIARRQADGSWLWVLDRFSFPADT